jgi:hypothetical protein
MDMDKVQTQKWIIGQREKTRENKRLVVDEEP